MAYFMPAGECSGKAQPALCSNYYGNECFSVLDLGTNNCRLMTAVPRAAGGFRVLDSFNRMVRLGEGLYRTERLTESAMARTIDALKICADRIERWGSKAVCAVATEACRRAKNGAAFLDRVKAETGFSISVISGREEACLAVEGCANLFHAKKYKKSQNRVLLFDIGGGSTEISWVRVNSRSMTHELIGYLSLPFGSSTLSEQFYPDRADDPKCYDSMVSCVRAALHEFESVHCIKSEIHRGQASLIGASSTISTLASLSLGLPRYIRSAVDGVQLPSPKVRQAVSGLKKMGQGRIKDHPCIGADRASSVLPGCAIFEAIHDMWPIEHVIVADRGLREGMMLRMIRATETARKGYYYKSEVRMADVRHFVRAGTT